MWHWSLKATCIERQYFLLDKCLCALYIINFTDKELSFLLDEVCVHVGYMVFMGHGFTSGGQESGCAFGAAVCEIQARKRYIESLPPVPKEKRSCLSQNAVQLPLHLVFALRK